MSTVQAPVSDLLLTVKAREVQRGLFAEQRGATAEAARHFLAAAHMELVLAEDYAAAGQDDLAFRSRLSAASCFWRAGQIDRARSEFDSTAQDFPSRAAAVQQTLAELIRERSGSGA